MLSQLTKFVGEVIQIVLFKSPKLFWSALKKSHKDIVFQGRCSFHVTLISTLYFL